MRFVSKCYSMAPSELANFEGYFVQRVARVSNTRWKRERYEDWMSTESVLMQGDVLHR